MEVWRGDQRNVCQHGRPVVKVSRDADGGVKIDQVWAVIDCGMECQPDIIRAQVEGSS